MTGTTKKIRFNTRSVPVNFERSVAAFLHLADLTSVLTSLSVGKDGTVYLVAQAGGKPSEETAD